MSLTGRTLTQSNLTPAVRAALLAELRAPEYDGLTPAEAHARLFAPRTETVTEPTGARLTPVVVARTIGGTKAELLAAAVRQTFPVTYEFLFADGLDPASAEVRAFLAAAPFLTADDRAALLAVAQRIVTRDRPPLACERFAGIAGFPNLITLDDFAPVFGDR